MHALRRLAARLVVEPAAGHLRAPCTRMAAAISTMSPTTSLASPSASSSTETQISWTLRLPAMQQLADGLTTLDLLAAERLVRPAGCARRGPPDAPGTAGARATRELARTGDRHGCWPCDWCPTARGSAPLRRRAALAPRAAWRRAPRPCRCPSVR